MRTRMLMKVVMMMFFLVLFPCVFKGAGGGASGTRTTETARGRRSWRRAGREVGTDVAELLVLLPPSLMLPEPAYTVTVAAAVSQDGGAVVLDRNALLA